MKEKLWMKRDTIDTATSTIRKDQPSNKIKTGQTQGARRKNYYSVQYPDSDGGRFRGASRNLSMYLSGIAAWDTIQSEVEVVGHRVECF